MDYTRFRWRLTEPQNAKSQIWQRDIDECEYFYTALARQYKASGRSFFHITGHLSLKITPPASSDANRLVNDALAKVWLMLRREHPPIASQTKWDPSLQRWIKQYNNSTDGWVEKTLVHVTSGQTGVEFANSDPPAPDMPTLFVLSPQQGGDGSLVTRDLVLRSPHDIIDGVGTLYLMNNLARLLSDALSVGGGPPVSPNTPEEEVSRLSPAYRVAAAVPEEMTESMKKRLSAMDAVYAPAKRSTNDDPEPIGLPYKKGELLPGKHQRVELVLSPDETARILSGSKELGATVTHVFHAAIAIVLRNRQERSTSPRAVQYINYILRNERDSCRTPFDDGAVHPAGVYHSVSSGRLVVDMTVPAESSTGSNVETREAFLAVVGQMKDFYHDVRDDKQHYALVPHIFARSTPNLPVPTEEPQDIPVPLPKELAPVSISSMGRIDSIMQQSYGNVELRSPWVTGEELGSGVGTFLGTFRGQLAFSAAYNDAWHNREGAEEFLRQCLGVVRSSLGLFTTRSK